MLGLEIPNSEMFGSVCFQTRKRSERLAALPNQRISALQRYPVRPCAALDLADTDQPLQAVADIVRTTLGPRSMLKMLLDPMGGIGMRCLEQFARLAHFLSLRDILDHASSSCCSFHF
jgi:hypothetical protein